MILLNKSLASVIDHASIHVFPWSDHSIVKLQLRNIAPRPRDYTWRLDNILLSQMQIAYHIGQEIKTYFQLNKAHDIKNSTLWAAHKAYVQGLLIQSQARRRKANREKISLLMLQLSQLEAANKTRSTTMLSRAIDKLRTDLNLLMTEQELKKLQWVKQKYFQKANKADTMLARKLILANRVSLFISDLIHKDQAGFIPHRQVTDNIRRVIDPVHFSKTKGTPSMLLSLDLEKAFDTVSWRYLVQTIQSYSFPPEFLNIIKALYHNPRERVQHLGFLFGTFQIKRGTRQGCPLSPLLFALIIEPLAIHIWQHADIHGLQIGDFHHKCVLYADDLLMLASKPMTSLPNLYKLLSLARSPV
ncbi:uncharacterized protein LOC108716019 [Xenopus laevis]|uniref:Uncharacterized protein LOC108716019 n=1 Tax=Xenopus laevis TaxID=8355 RepID=A0A8J0V907_XENLA|nr:uncharacterized protein LOC108716019 [Xenopus laevis]